MGSFSWNQGARKGHRGGRTHVVEELGFFFRRDEVGDVEGGEGEVRDSSSFERVWESRA